MVLSVNDVFQAPGVSTPRMHQRLGYSWFLEWMYVRIEQQRVNTNGRLALKACAENRATGQGHVMVGRSGSGIVRDTLPNVMKSLKTTRGARSTPRSPLAVRSGRTATCQLLLHPVKQLGMCGGCLPCYGSIHRQTRYKTHRVRVVAQAGHRATNVRVGRTSFLLEMTRSTGVFAGAHRVEWGYIVAYASHDEFEG